MTKSAKPKYLQAHTAPTKYGMGDYYGTGVKNPVGKLRSPPLEAQPLNKGKFGKPPKRVA